MPDPQKSWVSLSSSELSAEVDPLGAQLSTLRDRAGRDLLWNGDPAVWSGRAPVLFPIVGALAGGSYRLGEASYRLSRHGFARGKPFEILERNPMATLLRLQADEATLEVYPFRFELDIGYALAGPALSITLSVRNTGPQELPASLGYHPAFRWPLPFGQERAAHFIDFEADEPAPVRRLDADGLVTPELHPTPITERRLVLEDALFRSDALIFDQIASRSVTYGGPRGPRIRVSYPDAPYLGVWTKPGAQFICIEPWRGLADSRGFSGDFRDKTGIFTVAPGAVVSMNVTITLLGPGP
jgi:galactose mutarotase-like enzyme